MTTPDMTIDTLPKQAPAPDAPTPPAVPDESPERPSRRKWLLLLLLGFLFALFLAFALWYLLFRKPVSEIIPPSQNFAMPTFVNAAYNLTKPLGVAVAPDGSRIYVTQNGGTEEALVLDAQGKKVGTLTPPLPEDERPSQMFVAVDPGTGDVYTTDRALGQVFVYRSDGAYKKTLEPPAGQQVWQPMAITVDAKGNVYIADVSGSYTRIHEFSRGGAFVRDFGAEGQLNHPNGIAVDSKGNVLVSNTGVGTLVVFRPTAQVLGVIARGPGSGDLGLPRGLAIDDHGRLYVVDSAAQRVQVYRPIEDGASTPEFADKFGSEGTADGDFSFPNGVAVDSRGRIYIADWGNDRLQIWSY